MGVAQQQHYAANKVVMKERARAHTVSNRERLREHIRLTKDQPCLDCGLRFPTYVMEFDHVTGEKTGNVSDLVSNSVSLARLQREIDQCEVVCANCHRIRTFTCAENGLVTREVS